MPKSNVQISSMALAPTALADIVAVASQRSLCGAVLDGLDVETAISKATDANLIAEAYDIAERNFEWFWMERIAKRGHEINRTPETTLRLSYVLALTAQCDDAQRLLESITERSSDKEYRHIEGVIKAMTGRTGEAMAAFEVRTGESPYDCPVILFKLAYEILERCDLAYALALVSALNKRYPSIIYFRGILMRCHLLAGLKDEVAFLFDDLSSLIDNVSQADKRHINEALAETFALPGRTMELFNFVREGIAKDPTHWRLYNHAAFCAVTSPLNAEYAQIIAALPVEEHENPEVLAIFCRWHLDENRIDEASAFLEKIRPLSARLYLHARVWVSMYDGDHDKIEDAFDACARSGVALMGAAIAHSMHVYYYDCSPDRLRTCLLKLQQCMSVSHNSAMFWQIRLRCMIGIGELYLAEAEYRSLPLGLANGGALGPFRMFFDATKARDVEAAAGWTKYLRSTSHLCVNAPSSYPKTVQLRYVERPEDILLFTTLYNGVEHLDWFFDHYRALGVDHFFITDNGSNDGSLERLLTEPDVSVFLNAESFNKAGFGVLWLNHLMQRFGVGHWSFHVDLDEGFVFPGYGTSRSLRELLSYCDKHGYRGVAATEMDMYPERLDGQQSGDPFALSCYFDTDYMTINSEIPPYVMIQGGLRRRLTGLAVLMHKLPLVRVTPDLRFIECNHSTTHIPMADVTGALLHYKFVGDMKRRVDEAIDRKEHYFGAVFYRRLKGAIASENWDGSLLSKFSKRYEGPVSLMQHGLMQNGSFLSVNGHLPSPAKGLVT